MKILVGSLNISISEDAYMAKELDEYLKTLEDEEVTYEDKS